MRFLKSLVIAGAFGCAWAPLVAQAEPGDTMQNSGTAAAVVVDALTIQRLANLRFGRFAAPTTASTLRIGSNGTVTPSADIASSIGMAQPSDGRGPAQFRIELAGNRGFTAYIPGSLSITNGTSNMVVNSVEGRLVRIVNRGRQSVFRLDMGGTLQVNANQAPGQYSGNFTVTVVYL